MGRRMGIKQPTKAQLLRMREAGMGQTSMAKLLGVTVPTVRYYLEKNGLPLKMDTAYHQDATIDAAIERFRRAAG